MDTKVLILKLAGTRPFIRSQDILKRKNISRQTLAQHFRELIREGKLIKEGETRNARYILASKAKQKAEKGPLFKKFFLTKGLEEDRVFNEINFKMNLKKHLSGAGLEIVQFAFTEMLNNAIEHSGASRVFVEVICDGLDLRFRVEDKGVGAFENLKRTYKLRDHFEACELMLKGKQTTAPKFHTGQGIFFTSKIADYFTLDSARLHLIVDNTLPDLFLEEVKKIQGTHVSFRIKQKSRKNLKALFDEYTDSDFEFDKTHITVHLIRKEGSYVSRSEAKRILFGLEQFKRIVLDFKNITGIGQGFADEIFRVFQNQHPKITLEPVHMTDGVRFMIERARSEQS
ncbi:MAG: DUF4325 domain-containing protein [Deltaproteobacteria bacterium]|nr:DUF4325 domain-containing protein [Deltaproteobacteria bacterium]